MKRTPPPAGFDMNAFQKNVDHEKTTRTLTIAGKEIDLPLFADVNLSTSGPFIRLKVGEMEHRELQLACESRVKFSERFYDTEGNLIAEFKSDTGWATSGAPTIQPGDLDKIGKGKVIGPQAKGKLITQ